MKNRIILGAILLLLIIPVSTIAHRRVNRDVRSYVTDYVSRLSIRYKRHHEKPIFEPSVPAIEDDSEAPEPNVPEPSQDPEPTVPPLLPDEDPIIIPDNIIPSNMCMNYGHHEGSSQLDSDIALMKKNDINCVRIVYHLHSSQFTQGMAKYFNDRGFYVIFGGDDGTLNLRDLKAYNDRAVEAARWAESEGIDQFSLGNEQEYRLGDLNLAQWIVNLKYLASKVDDVYSGVISYELSGDYLDQYIEGGKGTLDRYGVSAYCCWEKFAQKATQAWGEEGVYFSEFNVDPKWVHFDSKQDQADALQLALNEMEPYDHMQLYYFTFRDGAYGTVANRWAVMRTDNTLETPIAEVLGIRL